MADFKNKTDQEITKKAEELSSALKFKVKPIVVKTKSGERVVGYYRQPSRQAKMAAFDKVNMSMTSAGELLLEASLIKEESDPRLYSLDPEHDDIVIGASLAMFEELNVASADLPKK